MISTIFRLYRRIISNLKGETNRRPMTLRFYIEPCQPNHWVWSILQYIPHESSSLDDCDYIVSTVIPYGCTDSQLIQQVLQSYETTDKQAIVTLCGQVQHGTRLRVKIKGTSLLSFKPCKVQWYAKTIVYKIEKSNRHWLQTMQFKAQVRVSSS